MQTQIDIHVYPESYKHTHILLSAMNVNENNTEFADNIYECLAQTIKKVLINKI